ncbi:DNA polymerase alpha subunit B [Hyposmocoma kahamanoa]|uniref:DNA polymerase alpha subunit B n=1 Tax=Hyposmocoma kahamanoa TaxID=1477025 RepID=UPI000E6D891B|nr:DNA polymerase alpha subunit B [Hyposmocoma kahamanoa]
MASERLVTEQFQFLGIEVQDEVLAKCVSLCDEYDIDAESLTEQWMAFSLNHLNGAAPTMENLDVFARKEFSKRAPNYLNAPTKEAARSSTGSTLMVYGAPISAQPENDVLSNYMTANAKRVKVEADVIPVQNELCPVTYSPSVNHSAKYASRTGQGSVVHSHGDEKLLERLLKPNGLNDVVNLNITLVPNDDGDLYTKSYFGFELLHEKASTFDNHIRYVSQCIMKKADIKDSSSVRHKSQAIVLSCAMNTKCLSIWKVMLHTIKIWKKSQEANCEIVVIRLKWIHFMKRLSKDMVHNLCDELKHPQNPPKYWLTLRCLIKQRIYITSSLKDAFHVNIYPTPEYAMRRKPANIHFVPDPCTLNLSGFVVGVTSTDVLMHISQEEISLGTGGDKLARLAGHVLSQQSYYPLWPPPPGQCVDAALWAAHAQLPCTPHVFIVPSNFRYFVKEVNGCVVVNPEHLAKGTGGGTFARLLISADEQQRNIAAQIVRI